MLHKLFPVVVVLDFIVDPPTRRLGARDALAWLVYPVLWVGLTVVRGAADGWYPYPFLDPANGGYGTVAATVVAITIGFLAIAAAWIWIGNRRGWPEPGASDLVDRVVRTQAIDSPSDIMTSLRSVARNPEASVVDRASRRPASAAERSTPRSLVSPRPRNSRRARLEVAPLGEARRPAGGGPVARPRRRRVAGHLEQVRRGRPRGGGRRRSARRRRASSSSSSPARGPSTIATATAWLSVTIGFGATRSSSS